MLGGSLAVGLTFAVVSYGGSTGRAIELPVRALARPAVASDALPHKPGDLVGQVLRSRRVATYTDRQGRSTNLFVYEAKGRLGHGATKRQVWFCLFRISQGAGGDWGCGSIRNVASTFAKHPLDADWGENPYDGEYVWGLAANNVQSVVLIESNGIKHNVVLSPDNGFIFNCGANGCAGSIDSYGQRGQLLSAQRLRALG